MHQGSIRNLNINTNYHRLAIPVDKAATTSVILLMTDSVNTKCTFLKHPYRTSTNTLHCQIDDPRASQAVAWLLAVF